MLNEESSFWLQSKEIVIVKSLYLLFDSCAVCISKKSCSNFLIPGLSVINWEDIPQHKLNVLKEKCNIIKRDPIYWLQKSVKPLQLEVQLPILVKIMPLYTDRRLAFKEKQYDVNEAINVCSRYVTEYLKRQGVIYEPSEYFKKVVQHFANGMDHYEVFIRRICRDMVEETEVQFLDKIRADFCEKVMQIAKTGNEKYHFSKFERILVDVGTLLRMSTRGTTERAMQICS